MSSRSIYIMYIHKLSLIEEIIGKRGEKGRRQIKCIEERRRNRGI